jgi:hypothetical protein
VSRQQVRQAVGDWVATATIPNLTQIYTSFPKRINFELNATAGQFSRAVGVVFIANETEDRVAVGGANDGWKRIDYNVEFQIFMHSMQSYAQDAMADFDDVIDGIKTQLRSGGHRLGKTDDDIIWQAAEPAISVSYGEPKTNDGGAVEIWAGINFIVTQMFKA